MNIRIESVRILRELMDTKGAKELARLTHIHRTTLYKVLDGKAAPGTIRKLEPIIKLETTSTP